MHISLPLHSCINSPKYYHPVIGSVLWREMKIRKASMLISAVFIIVFVALLSNSHFRWFLINGYSATELSKQMLSQSQTKTPDWAIDLVITSSINEQYVVFSQHASNYSYMYSENNYTNLPGYTWLHVIGSWYVGKIKT